MKCVGCGGLADPQCVDPDNGKQLPFCLRCEHYSDGGIDE